jgi:hypothetical protein
MARKSSHLIELAARGAEARLHELLHEAKRLVDAFPHLRDTVGRDDLPIPFILRSGRSRGTGRGMPRRKPMSAAAKKAVSLRMKKYWAARRKAQKGR